MSKKNIFFGTKIFILFFLGKKTFIIFLKTHMPLCSIDSDRKIIVVNKKSGKNNEFWTIALNVKHGATCWPNKKKIQM